MDNSLRIIREARRAGIAISLGFALIEHESGGKNIFGHDPTIYVGAGDVTKAKYLAYKRQRGSSGRGGMQGVGPCQLCVAPETPVLTADLRWIAAESVCAGMEIIAFDEDGVSNPAHRFQAKRRYFRTATVLGMHTDVMERVCVKTDQREVVVTPDHKFLTHRPERYTWKAAKQLSPGDKLPNVPTWQTERTYEAGYLAGQFDGEGCLTVGMTKQSGPRNHEHVPYGRLLWSQAADSPEVPLMWSLLEARGFSPTWHKAPPKDAPGTLVPGSGKPVASMVMGRQWEQLRFLGSIRPNRMLRHPKLRDIWEKRQLNGCGRETVLAVTPLEPGLMVAHLTSTSTLLTDGLLSHNTWYSTQDAADKLGGCWKPACNIRQAFTTLAGMIRQHGYVNGIVAYNGSGSAARHYSVAVRATADTWHRRLS